MIFTYHPYQESRLYNGTYSNVDAYEIKQASIICADKSGKPKPNQKVYIKCNGVVKQAFSNFMIENGAINEYNKYKYNGTGGTGNITDARWAPGVSQNSLKNQTYKYGWYHQTYLTTTLLKNSDDGDYSKFRLLKAEDDSIPGKTMWSSNYCVLKEEHVAKINNQDVSFPGRPSIGEFPSPIMIRTDNGTVVKFYSSSNFATPIYWQECVGRVTPVYNLIPKKIYYYKVFKNSTALTGIYESNNNYGIIVPEGQVRMIKFTHIRNARDCGGWKTSDGKYQFKYDVLFRGSQLDGRLVKDNTAYTNQPYNVEVAAIDTLEDRKEFYKLGISHEVDFRGATGSLDTSGFRSPSTTVSEMIRVKDNGSSESAGISYYRYGGVVASYQATKDKFAQFVAYLNSIVTNIRNGKKVYIHCQQGKDRTGTYVALIQALCGIESDAIVKDYEISSMWCSGTYSRFEFQKGELSSGTAVTASNSTWGTFGVTSSKTIQDAVKDWFTNNYSSGNILECTTAAEAIGVIKEAFLDGYVSTITPSGDETPSQPEPVLPPSTSNPTRELTILGGYNGRNFGSNQYNISTVVKNSSGTTLTTASTNGVTITPSQYNVTVSTTVRAETLLGYSDISGNLIGNTIDIRNTQIVTPKVAGNLIYNLWEGQRWVDVTVSGYYTRLVRKSNANFCATSHFYVNGGASIKITIPDFAGKTVKFEIINTDKPSGLYTSAIGANQIHKVVSLSLNSKGQATYTVTFNGFTVMNFACGDVSGFTKFTKDQIKLIQVNYSNVTAWGVPTFSREKVFRVGNICQSIVYYNDYIVAFYDRIGMIKVVDLKTNTVVRSVPTSSVITPASGDNRVHCNSAALMPIKYDSSDFFPMIILSGDGAKARILRLVGSDPAGVSASVVCDWIMPGGGMVAVAGNNLYFLRWSVYLYKVNIDITSKSNYVNKTFTYVDNCTQLSDKILKTGQAMSAFTLPGNKGDMLVAQYGPENDQWKVSSDKYYYSGMTFCSIKNQGRIVAHIPFDTTLTYLEPDGVAYAGNNIFYVMLNNEGQADLYKFIIPFPEF